MNLDNSFKQMFLEHIDPNGIFSDLSSVEVISTGRIFNPSAKDIKTGKSLFLHGGAKLIYDFTYPCGYDSYSEDGYEYCKSVKIVYVTSKQYTLLCLMA